MFWWREFRHQLQHVHCSAEETRMMKFFNTFGTVVSSPLKKGVLHWPCDSANKSTINSHYSVIAVCPGFHPWVSRSCVDCFQVVNKTRRRHAGIIWHLTNSLLRRVLFFFNWIELIRDDPFNSHLLSLWNTLKTAACDVVTVKRVILTSKGWFNMQIPINRWARDSPKPIWIFPCISEGFMN